MMALEIYRKLGLGAKILTCLYDSLVTVNPLEERHVVARIHTAVMSELNTWEYDDERGKRTLKYKVDNEFNYRWSTRPDKATQALLDSAEFYPTPERLAGLELAPAEFWKELYEAPDEQVQFLVTRFKLTGA